ncbi:MAG TPA: geranylgeranyl reductase family protein [Dehalococcoidia bacterium]|nr:geranylgeranyl reductase family protein [Dehalococcoidia bacterium]
MRYDAIVAGAGPAGSTAARTLAREGASVLLLDRARFPRDKPCGGGVTLRAAACQEIDLTPVVERTVTGARFSLRLGDAFDRRYEKPLTYMTQRSRLDAFLAEEAIAAGATFQDGEPVRSVETTGNGGSGLSLTPRVTVRTERGSYFAGALIGADGANGVVGRDTATRPETEVAVALEGNLPYPDGVPEDWREFVGLDVGGLAGGYGWVFPKGDHLNVGVGAWRYAAFTLRPKLADLCARYGFDPNRLESLRGHHLPVRVPGSTIARGPVAVAGDAAGLVDPLSGEGIHMAFMSGRLAARAALRMLAGEADDMSAYQRAVDRRLQPELSVSRKLQELFHFAPPPYVTAMRRSEKFWRFFCHLIRGEMTYLDFLRMIGPLRLAVDVFASAAQRRRLSRLAAVGRAPA